LSSCTFLDKAFGKGIDGGKQHDDPEQRIPGKHRKIAPPDIENDMADKNRTSQIQQHRSNRVLSPPFVKHFLVNEQFDFFEHVLVNCGSNYIFVFVK
jgi:hypothetical protein